MLDATFENGDHFLVAVESILPASSRAAHVPSDAGSNGAATITLPEWGKLRIGETGDVLEVLAGDAVMEVPWDRIRSVADPEFRAHLADHAVERARYIGERIRAMRLEAELTPAALAERLGVSRQIVANLEAGKIEPGSDLIERVAVALGRRLRDFAEV